MAGLKHRRRSGCRKTAGSGARWPAGRRHARRDLADRGRREHHDPPPRSQLGVARPGRHRVSRPITSSKIRAIIARPHGILLVTGPTGSGKTTTLYACLSEINSPDINILTVEDPVEYQLEGISQTQVNSKIEADVRVGPAVVLRQDPDVIMVGEIRDRETAEVAITASLTGHLVFSTVHTNDAAGGITRLIDMGIEPFLVAFVAGRPPGPAPRAPAVRGVRRARSSHPRKCCASSASSPTCSSPVVTCRSCRRVRALRPPPGRHGLRAGRLPRVRPARLPRPDRHLRAC